MTDRSNSPVSSGALEELTRGIEEKARDTNPSFHLVPSPPHRDAPELGTV